MGSRARLQAFVSISVVAGFWVQTSNRVPEIVKRRIAGKNSVVQQKNNASKTL
jgi:hypothetical protein